MIVWYRYSRTPRRISSQLDLEQSNISRPSKDVERDAPGRVADAEYEVVLTPKKSQDELLQQEICSGSRCNKIFQWRDAL